jgi:uncharacterized protein YicC (UPF0701 family)
MILDMVNQNVQETLKKFQDNKNREFEKAQEQIKETINELRMKTDNIKEEETQVMQNLRKKKNRNAKCKANPVD